jgi:hypothetical protein
MKSPLSVVILIAVCITASFLSTSCTLSLGVDGKPVVGISPTALTEAYQLWQARSNSKDSTVQIIDEK